MDGTTLTYSPPVAGAPSVLHRGQFAELVATARFEIASDKPILIAQLMHGSADELVPSGGDPSMVIITPAEQGVGKSTFSVHGLTGSTGPFLNIVTPTSALSGLVLDGTPVDSGSFATVGSSGFSAAAIPIAAGAHTLQGSAPFT